MPACRATPTANRVPVFAASSLTEAFTALEVEFERRHPGDDIQLTFAGSQVLRLQIEQGAPAQVFASANPAHLSALTTAGLVPRSMRLAENPLTVIVPRDNPAGIRQFSDLSKARRLVIGNAQAPIGRYTRQVFARAAQRRTFARAPRPVSEESNVRIVRAKVELGEADAAIVYRSDAGLESLKTIAIPADVNVSAEYRIGAVSNASAGGIRFVEFALSPAGQRILRDHGFDPAQP